jgi:hypothetical protein
MHPCIQQTAHWHPFTGVLCCVLRISVVLFTAFEWDKSRTGKTLLLITSSALTAGELWAIAQTKKQNDFNQEFAECKVEEVLEAQRRNLEFSGRS